MVWPNSTFLLIHRCQARAKHLFGVDWEHHHNIGWINRTAFLLYHLSDMVDGARSYDGWIIGDIYEQTDETFGICPFPGAFVVCYRPGSHVSSLLSTSCSYVMHSVVFRVASRPVWNGASHSGFSSQIPAREIELQLDAQTGEGGPSHTPTDNNRGSAILLQEDCIVLHHHNLIQLIRQEERRLRWLCAGMEPNRGWEDSFLHHAGHVDWVWEVLGKGMQYACLRGAHGPRLFQHEGLCTDLRSRRSAFPRLAHHNAN